MSKIVSKRTIIVASTLFLAIGMMIPLSIFSSQSSLFSGIADDYFGPYALAYSVDKANYPTEKVGYYEATSRFVPVRFYNFDSHVSSHYVSSDTAGEHYFYNTEPISGITSLSINAECSSAIVAISYNPIDYTSFANNTRPDMYVIANFGYGSLRSINSTDLPILANARYFFYYDNSSSVTIDTIGINYSCYTSGLSDPGMTPRTNWTTSEQSSLATFTSTGPALPYIGDVRYDLSVDTNYINIDWYDTTSTLFSSYLDSLETAGYDKITVSGMVGYQYRLSSSSSVFVNGSFQIGADNLTGQGHISLSIGAPINQKSTYPSDEISAFFASGTQSFPAINSGSSYTWAEDADNHKVQLMIAGITSSEYDAIVSSVTTAGFIASPFGSSSTEKVNLTTSSSIELSYYDENELLYVTLGSCDDILSSFPLSELQVFFTDYTYGDNTYTQGLTSYASSNARYMYSTDVDNHIATVKVAYSSQSELDTWINSLVALSNNNGFIALPYNSYKNTNIALLNASKYFTINIDLTNADYYVLTLRSGTNDFQTNLVKYDTWSDLSAYLTGENVALPNDYPFVIPSGVDAYYYDNSSSGVILTGISNSEYTDYINALTNLEGTYRAVFDYTLQGYTSTIQVADGDGYFYPLAQVNTTCLANGSIGISFGRVNNFPTQITSWPSSAVHAQLGDYDSGITSDVPSLANDDSSRTFSFIPAPGSQNFYIDVVNATSEDIETYIGLLTNSTYNFVYNYDSNLSEFEYVNYEHHLGVTLTNNIANTGVLNIRISCASSDILAPYASWPASSVYTGINTLLPTDIAELVAASPLTATGSTIFLKNPHGDSSSGEVVLHLVDITEGSQERDIDNLQTYLDECRLSDYSVGTSYIDNKNTYNYFDATKTVGSYNVTLRAESNRVEKNGVNYVYYQITFSYSL